MNIKSPIHSTSTARWPRLLGHLMLGVGLLITTACSDPQADPLDTRQGALDLVLDTAVDPSAHPSLEVFASPFPLAAGTVIEEAHDDDLAGPRTLTVLEEDSWVFFADYAPGWIFEHPAEVVVVSPTDGSVQQFPVDWWPLIDGQERWRTLESRDDSGDKVWSNIDGSVPAPVDQARAAVSTASAGPTVPGYCRPEDIQRWALTVGASKDIAIDPTHANDVALLLKRHGYQADSLGPGALTQGQRSVEAALANIRNKILATPDEGFCDEFVLVWNGHGSRSGQLSIPSGPTFDDRWMTNDELAIAVEQTTEKIEGMQVRVFIDSCYAATQIPRFLTRFPVHLDAKEPNDVVRDVYILTSSGENEKAMGAGAPGDTSTEDLAECIEDANGVNFATLHECISDEASTQTPQHRSWWNIGD